MKSKLFYYLVLTRPANVVTAVSDILAGIAISGSLSFESFETIKIKALLLILSTVGLYAGGVVFNDVFDYDLDKLERPERPIPSGIISVRRGAIFGLCLLLFGIIMAYLTNSIAGIIALAIALMALFYDKYGKHLKVIGPVSMGLCRGLNLFLGMSVFIENGLSQYWAVSLIPILFVAAITLTSQGEIHGNNKKSVSLALVIDVIIVAILLILCFSQNVQLWAILPFILFWAYMNFRAKLKAIKNNVSINIMKAVKAGVLSLIPLNAAYVAIFSGWPYGLIVLILLPISLLLAKKFAVT